MVMDWRFEIQWRGPFRHRMYPDTDHDLRISRCSGGMERSENDAYWGHNLASVSVHSLFGVMGKLRKAEISFDRCVVNVIPRYLQPLKYFTTYHAAATCDGFVECRFCANIFVIVAISVCMPQASHVREPKTYWSCSCDDCCLEGGRWSAEAILSIGYPNMKGG